MTCYKPDWGSTGLFGGTYESGWLSHLPGGSSFSMKEERDHLRPSSCVHRLTGPFPVFMCPMFPVGSCAPVLPQSAQVRAYPGGRWLCGRPSLLGE